MIKIAELSVYHKYFRWTFIEELNFDAQKWVEEKEFVNDCDSCGNRTAYYVVVRDGVPSFYKMRHAWWWENFDHKDSYLRNEFEWSETSHADLVAAKDSNSKEAAENLKFVV